MRLIQNLTFITILTKKTPNSPRRGPYSSCLF